MFIIRVIFFGIIAYFVTKLLKGLFEPAMKTSTGKSNVNIPKSEPIHKNETKSAIGDYIEFEEVKAS